MSSNKERQTKYKQSLRDAGLVPLVIWLHPDDKIKVKQLAEKLNLKRGTK